MTPAMLEARRSLLSFWSMEGRRANDGPFGPWATAERMGEIAKTRIGQRSPREAFLFARRAAHAAFKARPDKRG